MTTLRKWLEARDREQKAHQKWFESWHTQSPWLTTLVSTLEGPLVILILLLTIGPYVLNRLVTYVCDSLGQVNLMIIRQQYEPLAHRESDL